MSPLYYALTVVLLMDSLVKHVRTVLVNTVVSILVSCCSYYNLIYRYIYTRTSRLDLVNSCSYYLCCLNIGCCNVSSTIIIFKTTKRLVCIAIKNKVLLLNYKSVDVSMKGLSPVEAVTLITTLMKALKCVSLAAQQLSRCFPSHNQQ